MNRDEDGSAWALEEICRFIRARDLPVMVMADAVKAVQNPRKSFGPNVDRVKIESEVAPAGRVYVEKVSWRVVN